LIKKDLIAVSRCSLFRRIPPDEVETFLSALPGRIKEYEKDEILRFQGDLYPDLLIVLTGQISAEIINLDGKKIIIETLPETSALATAILFATENHLPVTLTAMEPVRILEIPREAVIGLLQQNRQFLENYLAETGDKVVFLAEKIRLIKFKSISQKIAGYLLGLSQRQRSDNLRLPYSREQLADLFGVARPSLSRSFSEFHDAGLLSYRGKRVTILDRPALAKIITGP